MQIPLFLYGALTLTILCALGVFALLMSPELLRPKAKRKGEWVAEVWLEWEICRGSTMYRQRFKTRRGAYLAVRAYAFVLDMHLPTHYWDIDWSGRRCRYEHEYGIRYGVRKLAEVERQRFSPIWTVDMPGTNGHAGEHASAHPYMVAGQLQGSTDGYRL